MSYRFSCHFCDADIVVTNKQRVGSVSCEACPAESRRPLVICPKCTLSWNRIRNWRRRCRLCQPTQASQASAAGVAAAAN